MAARERSTEKDRDRRLTRVFFVREEENRGEGEQKEEQLKGTPA